MLNRTAPAYHSIARYWSDLSSSKLFELRGDIVLRSIWSCSNLPMGVGNGLGSRVGDKMATTVGFKVVGFKVVG